MMLLNAIRLVRMAACAGLAVIVGGHRLYAADLSLLCASALQPAMQAILPEFEKASGHAVKVEYANIGTITERVRRGDAVDLVTVSPQQWETLRTAGRIADTSPIVIGKAGFGVSMKRGATRPDIGSVTAFKQTLLAATSIAVNDPQTGSPAGLYLMLVLDRLGITAEIRPKLRIIPNGTGNIIADAIVKQGAEFGVDPIPLILGSPDVELVGPFPPELQSFIVYTAASPAVAQHAEAAQTLVAFLTSARGAALLKSKGFDPG